MSDTVDETSVITKAETAVFTAYVCCLVFNEDKDAVVLIEKQKGPEILLGKWNGPGGKINPGESILDAATREFGEETGLYVPPNAWRNIFNLGGPNYHVAFVTAAHKFAENAETMEDENVELTNLAEILDLGRAENFPRNIPWMCLLALDETHQFCSGTAVN